MHAGAEVGWGAFCCSTCADSCAASLAPYLSDPFQPVWQFNPTSDSSSQSLPASAAVSGPGSRRPLPCLAFSLTPPLHPYPALQRSNLMSLQTLLGASDAAAEPGSCAGPASPQPRPPHGAPAGGEGTVASAAEDLSVHRKMLALMALDRQPSAGLSRCSWCSLRHECISGMGVTQV